MNAREAPQQTRFRFTPEQRAELDEGLARILAEREAREWAAAVGAAIPALVQAATEAAEMGTRVDDV